MPSVAPGHGCVSMDCPRCGEPDVGGPECPSCGVILAKARAPRPRASQGSANPAPSASRRLGLVSVALIAVAVAAGLWAVRRDPPALAPAPAPATGAALDTTPRPEGPLTVAPPRQPPPEILVPAAPLAPPDAGARAAADVTADQAAADRLGALLRNGLPAGPGDLRAAEDLHRRHGEAVLALLEAVLINTALQEHGARRHDEAVRLLQRAESLAPASPQPPRTLMGVYLDTGRWAEAGDAALRALALSPDDPHAARGLAYALVRQDRTRDAIEILDDLLDRHEDAEARALLARIEADAEAETGLTEQRLAHFHVRYDGEEHVAVGREVLRVLDRHYATLVRALDHQPRAPIPVILFSQESYAAATGAPDWSGGLYDSFDGRVRIPIAGLTPSLTPDMDDTLLHELTHAFVTDRSRGVAPRVLQEGLAQLMEGKSVEVLLDQRGLEALAEGRFRGVGGFYMTSLAFVEYLEALRGHGGLNDLLDAMAETGDADEAFRRVYGKDAAGLQKEWSLRFRRRHGR